MTSSMVIMVAGLALGLLLVLLTDAARARPVVSPRIAAATYLVSLMGWALLPALWLACLGGTFDAWLQAGGVGRGSCLLGLAPGEWRLPGYLPAVVAATVLAWQGARAVVGAFCFELRWATLTRGAIRRSVSRGAGVWVVPSPQPAAFAGGLWRSRALVTTGLLDQLEEKERQAVCEHEAAHVRLGHHQALLLGGIVAGAYGLLPPVRRAWRGLRAELEAAADDEAARVAGREVVLCALAKAALLSSGEPARGAGFAEREQLLYRINRLERPERARLVPTVGIGSLAVAGVGVIAWVACFLTGLRSLGAGMAACATLIGLACSRPVWSAALDRRPARHQ